jgi:galactokinase
MVHSMSNAIHTSAPARVNLIGEHVDYNGGFVLPTVLPRLLHVELMPRQGDRVQVASRQRPAGSERYAGPAHIKPDLV